jgi:DUF177 domain-containing protein
MLQYDLRELARGPIETQAELAADDALFAGLGIALAAPVRVGGRLQPTGEGRFYWHGSLQTVVAGECRRCLTPVSVRVEGPVGALFTEDAEAQDDPDAYPLPPRAIEVDLRPAVRDELALLAPRYVVCREDCRGLCPRCGKDLNAGPCGCGPAPDLRWQALADLKGKLRD